ncbi:hypothetical protein [Sorangium sp. So ce388]|uniref:hypothetical protein n=1 Tax=Sorangium sp. So ce388 TaxID=3133309 RepID=UPI003F5B556C
MAALHGQRLPRRSDAQRAPVRRHGGRRSVCPLRLAAHQLDHYTTVRNDAGLAAFSYASEGPDGRVLPFQTSGSVPLWRYWNPTNKDHYYTVDRNDAGLSYFGYSFEVIEGFVHAQQVPGTVPLYRWWNPTIGDHFYTTGTGDASWFGYTFERVEAYVYP